MKVVVPRANATVLELLGMRLTGVLSETPRILGKPFSVQDDLPDSVLFFGDLRQYLWFDRERMVIESTILPLAEGIRPMASTTANERMRNAAAIRGCRSALPPKSITTLPTCS